MRRGEERGVGGVKVGLTFEARFNMAVMSSSRQQPLQGSLSVCVCDMMIGSRLAVSVCVCVWGKG